MLNLLIQIKLPNYQLNIKSANYQQLIRLCTGSITILSHKSIQNHIYSNKDTQPSKEGRKYSLSLRIQLITKPISIITI